MENNADVLVMVRNVRKSPAWILPVAISVGLVIAFSVMLLVWVVEVDPKVLAPVGVLGGTAIVVSAFAVTGFYRVWKIRSFPVIFPNQMGSYIGRRVMVAGVALGEQVVSPWSGRNAVYSEAERIEHHRTSDGNGRRITEVTRVYLGHVGLLHIALDNHSVGFPLQPDTFTLLHLPETASDGSVAGLSWYSNIFSPRTEVREILIASDTPLWITGVVFSDGNSFDAEEWIQVSGVDAFSQTKFLIITSAVLSIFSVMLLLMMTAILSV